MTAPTLIGLTGRQRSGKDATAKILREHYGYGQVAFADAIRRMSVDINPILGDGTTRAIRLAAAVRLVGWEKVKAEPEARRITQAVGSAVRNQSPTFWLDQVEKLLTPGQLIVVSDVRFPAEAELVAKHGGTVWRIERPDYDGADVTNTDHISEHALDDYSFPTVINDGTLLDLERAILTQICATSPQPANA